MDAPSFYRKNLTLSKQAVAALGKLEYLATKTEYEDNGRLIQEFRFGDIVTFDVAFDQASGTEICITDLKSVVNSNQATISSTTTPYLGARYRRFLRPDSKALNLAINLRRLDKPEDVKYSRSVHEVKPIYFHPSTRNNEPAILKHKIGNTAWGAELTFGYAPTKDEEYAELQIQKPTKFDPYFVSQEKQGLDVLFQDRVILFHQWSEQKIVPAKHPNWNHIRGEIDLKHGFSTAITKNSIIHDRNFSECIDEIRDILTGKKAGPGGRIKDYLQNKRYPEDIPEVILRNRLCYWLANNSIHKRKVIRPEYVIEGIEGFVDIVADGEAWELKVDQASSHDVYQLFMYMDVGKINKGYLVAQSFSPGAIVARDHIFQSHLKEIVLAPRADFPINGQFTDAERADYFG